MGKVRGLKKILMGVGGGNFQERISELEVRANSKRATCQ